MTYSANSRLPEVVRNALDENQQTEWREIFNSTYEGAFDRNDECASKIAWSRMKKHPRYFEGDCPACRVIGEPTIYKQVDSTSNMFSIIM